MNAPSTLPPWVTRVLENPLAHALAGAGVLLLDLATSKYLVFPIVFVIPVTLAAWHCRPIWAYFLAATLPVGRIFVALHDRLEVPTGYLVANGFTRSVVLALLAFFVARTSRQTKELEKQVAGLVTMCAWSRTIEFEGEWISFEQYLERRFNLATTHGISPEEWQKMLQEKDSAPRLAGVPPLR